jgi:hypothetical protein
VGVLEYPIDGISARQVSFGVEALRLEPLHRLIQQLAVAIILVDDTGVPGRARGEHRIERARRNDGQYVHLSVQEYGKIGAAPQRSAPRGGSVVPQQDALEHNTLRPSIIRVTLAI